MRIAVVGAGDIGATLGGKWIDAGHKVVFGARDLKSGTVTELRAKLGDDVPVASIAEALAESDVVLFAITGSAMSDVVSEHAEQLAGRIVIDATNQRVKGQAEATGEWGERTTLNSVGLIGRHAPSATTYRAFNHYSWEVFAQPNFGGRRADLFYAGPSGEGQAVVEQLIDEVGLRPVRLGGLEQVETVDGLLAVWAALAMFEGKGRANIAFATLERNIDHQENSGT